MPSAIRRMSSVLQKLLSSSSTKKPDPPPQREECRLVLIGDHQVGKTSLAFQFVFKEFLVYEYTTSVGDDYRSLRVVDGNTVLLDVIDTILQMDYDTLLSRKDPFSKNIQARGGFLLVYTISSRTSFENLRGHIKQLSHDGAVPFPGVVVGNKSDNETDREVSTADGRALAEEFRFPFFETSAKDRTNVDRAFGTLVREVRKFHAEPPIQADIVLEISATAERVAQMPEVPYEYRQEDRQDHRLKGGDNSNAVLA